MRALRGAAIAAASLVLSAAVVTAAAPAPNTFGIGVTPARLEWKLPPETTDIAASVLIFNKGSRGVEVSITVSDVVIDAVGAWQLLPAGATPYTLPATFTPSALALKPGESAKVKITAHIDTSRPRFGGALIHPIAIDAAPQRAPGGIGTQVNPDLLVPLVAAPVGTNGVVEGVELRGQAAGFKAPLIVEHGPIAATVAARNTSDFYERSFTTLEYNFLGHTYLTQDMPPVGTFPGTVAVSTANSIVQAPGAGAIDVSPWIGLVHVTATTHMVLLDSTAPPIVQDRWILILPYRVLLGLLWLVVAGVLAKRVRRRRQ